MPVHILEEEISFPHPSFSDKDGLLAIGGDLSPDRLLFAYANGIYPWFDEGSPILWWSPDPRMILIPGEFKRVKSLKQTIRKGKFEIRFDENFRNVIMNCAQTGGRGEEGSRITPGKVALSSLVDWCLEWDFHFIDAQQRTEHLRSLGAKPKSRDSFLSMLAGALKYPTLRGKW